MGKKIKEWAKVLEQEKITNGVYDLWIHTEAAQMSVPGQFVSLYCREGSRLLPRPISICEVDKKYNEIRLVYRVVGEGTKELSKLREGSMVEIMGPLGNGFPLKEGKAFLIGGGIGIPPMLELAKQLPGEKEDKQIILGYADTHLFLLHDLRKQGCVYVSTDDGSVGVHGTVMDTIHQKGLTADVIYACGPTPMLRAVQQYANTLGIECYLSLEERMACGIGVCLACVCETTQEDAHSHVHNARICADGPVFNAKEVVL